MPEADKETHGFVVICVDSEPESLAALQSQVDCICGSKIGVKRCRDAEQVLALAGELSASGVRAALIITEHTLPGMSGIDLLLALRELPDFRATRTILATVHAGIEDLSRALNRGALHRLVTKPCSGEELGECVRSLLTSFFVHHAPGELDRLADILDGDQIPRSFKAGREKRRALDAQIKTLRRSFLATVDMSDEQVELAMGAAIDEALNSPPRQTFAANEIILRQGEPVDTIHILLSGQVQLSRETDGQEVVLHRQSTGRIIGLLALARRGRAFYTCRATSDVISLPLTLEQLDTALQTDPFLGGYFVTALIRSMATRAMRTAQLKMEVESLNRSLRSERDELAGALDKLERAQMRLVESEKMATLGQLTAGIAHELNNPVAAIRRAAEFLVEDIVAVVAKIPSGESIRTTLLSALQSTPVSTRELRKLATVLTATVGDQALTRRMMKVGITTPEAYREQFGRMSAKKRESILGDVERYHQLGTALRDVRVCSDRIAGIVEGMRSYARSDQEVVGGVDVHLGLEDTLRLLAPALATHHIKRSYGDLPTIECRVGQLNQVWTNLISNAAQAMGESGTLRIETDAPDPDYLRVRITDSGKGIPPESRDRIFDMHFTTKGGRVAFGLGIGLPICRQIIVRHGGTITVESQPGETCFTVALPVRHPNDSKDEANS